MPKFKRSILKQKRRRRVEIQLLQLRSMRPFFALLQSSGQLTTISVTFDGVKFQLVPVKTGVPNAVVSKGQSVNLPEGHCDRVYILAASAAGDQKATFEVGEKKAELSVQDWGGFIGQWDDRQWSSKDTSHDNYGEMIGIRPSFIKRADLAWYCSHHHNAAGEDIPY